jgi:succinate dehydrogenase / fumarate reductase cytochrome b subunit
MLLLVLPEKGEALMAIARKVGFFQGLRYHGGIPMVAWMLHRISGIGMLAFVGLHVTSSFLTQQFGSNVGVGFNTIYESWAFQILIIFFVLFHVLNGLRIAVLDIWPQFLTYEREALWLQLFVFAPVYVLAVFFLVQHGLSGG